MRKLLSTRSTLSLAVLTASAILFVAGSSKANIVITEVDANGNSSVYGQDWFELTNTGASAQDITGWKMDDNSNSFGSAVALRGITSIAPGQSVVFIEDGTNSANDAALDANFASFWFGSNVPAGLTIANYGGSGVGLSSASDAVNIFDASGNPVTGVTFGSSSLGATFDNAAGLSGAISTLSAVGVNGAFSSAGTPSEVGSPGVISSAAPEPASVLLVGIGAGLLTFRRSSKKA